MLSKVNTVGEWYQNQPDSGWDFDEITFDKQAIADFQDLDLEIVFQAHSAKIKIKKKNRHVYIPSHYFLYAIKLQPLAALLNNYTGVFDQLRPLMDRDRLERFISDSAATHSITNELDVFSKENFFALYGDADNRLGAKSIFDKTTVRGSPEFRCSILLKAMPVPDSSSSQLATFIDKFSQSPVALEVLINKYSKNIPYIFISESGDNILFQILSTLGWQGKLDTLFDNAADWGGIKDAFKAALTPVVGNHDYIDQPIHYSEMQKQYYFVKKDLLTTPESLELVSGLVSELWPNMEIRKNGSEFRFCSKDRPIKAPSPFLSLSARALKVGINKIYYGAPGTGKSHTISELTRASTKVVSIFHPDTQYSDFVGALKPRMSGRDITYEFRPGPFTKALICALNNPNEHIYLIIEEINRAPAAAVFGELFQLLDRDAAGRSQYSIDAADPDMLDYINKHLTRGAVGQLVIPENLSLLATMNSSDQAVMPLDTAFKRRWSFEYLKIDFSNPEIPKQTLTLKTADDKSWNISWADFADKVINYQLKEARVPEDRLLGPFFLDKVELATPEQALDSLAGKLFVYLWDDVLRHKDKDHIFSSNLTTFGDLHERFTSRKKGVFSESVNSKIIEHGTEIAQIEEPHSLTEDE